jgi:hypothetical protein
MEGHERLASYLMAGDASLPDLELAHVLVRSLPELGTWRRFRRRLVLVSVMYVRAVDVAVGDGVMPMHVGVRLAYRIARGMNVVVVLIVDMAVLVLQDSMGVQVAVLLSQERRDAQGQHEHGDPFASSEVVAEDRDGR